MHGQLGGLFGASAAFQVSLRGAGKEESSAIEEKTLEEKKKDADSQYRRERRNEVMISGSQSHDM